jgi:hypothetical protein
MMIQYLIHCCLQITRYFCQDSDDDIQRSLHNLHSTTEQCEMNVSSLKSKVIANKGQSQIRSKILIDNTILEQVCMFTYLGCTNKILYKEEKRHHFKNK